MKDLDLFTIYVILCNHFFSVTDSIKLAISGETMD